MDRLNESKIFHLSEMEEFFGTENWKLEINIMDIWNKYSNKELTVEQFNKEYVQRIIKYKSEILGMGNDVWNSLVPLINELNTKTTLQDSSSIYESIYDIGDKYDILIKTK